ncbi:hypothetical protein OB69_10380 [Roseivirga seohaensis subsp. aquiponti]|uniref:DUF4199 domain-containing protein n=1 Tax=Roseivirga seohaensis subsp. aquiponti TaxID=1566026 RepID=A0A0L8AJV0_9BACT|nr:DUF4199 domain-containing protein [Roseivirga seohaensis]KOF02713.1 hypothetical protein OB69_10380 [Roseivirga seohaensis subsp. aquiponti]
MIKVNPKLTRISIKYGAVTALFTIIAFLVFYFMGLQPWRNLLSFLLDIMVIVIFLFLALKDYKDNVGGGEFRFYHGMTIGFIVYVTTAAIFALFYLIFIYWGNPDFLSEYIKTAQDDLVNRKEMIVAALSEESYLEQYKMIANTTRSTLVFDVFIKKLLIGLVVTPVFSIILRSSRA